MSRLAAYLDPGAGSLLVQLLLGGVAAVAVTARFYGRKMLAALGLRRTQGGTED